MNSIAKKIIPVFALIVILSVGSQAKADEYCRCGGGFRGAYGFGYSGSLYGLGYIPVPPYHAIHPPVYYGDIVRRTYGTSPFAARAPKIPYTQPKAKPKMVMNDTINKPAPKPAEKAGGSKTAAARPQMIINPYFKPERRLVSRPQ